MDGFFDQEKIKNLIQKKLNFLSENVTETEFQKLRDRHCINILKNMESNAKRWDEYTSFNNDRLSDALSEMLSYDDYDDEIMNYLFATLFRFLMEYNFKSEAELDDKLNDVKFFAIKERDRFNGRSLTRIDFSINILPFSLMREKYQSSDVKSFIKAVEVEGSMKVHMADWDKTIDGQIKRVTELNEKLKEQEVAYNFVGLYKGFHNLSRAKRIEAKTALFNTRMFGFLAIIPLVFEAIMLTVNSNGTWFDSFRIALIPAFALTFILVYYFRVSLSSYQSIKSQIVQIELRKSLCTFIQNYSTYAEKMTDKESLRKFENVIFSNIMPSEDKIPSTFDGIEQIAKLIESIKK
ncbi:hypothetical protein QM999_13080 [Pectobacterium cacticida]|uniref:hypothetical protein n=1 Tax=Pectobacterium cacticida TaxID=69221 RepID=UPI002FF04408